MLEALFDKEGEGRVVSENEFMMPTVEMCIQISTHNNLNENRIEHDEYNEHNGFFYYFEKILMTFSMIVTIGLMISCPIMVNNINA